MRWIIGVLLVLGSVPSLRGQSSGLADDPTLSSNLTLYEIWVRERMAYYGQPGISIGLVHDQELVWAHGFGYRDVERRLPATPETIYRIASITKTFTATAIMQLRDAGKLRLDDPVKMHLPWLEYRNRFPGEPVITIEQLLTHTSGLPRESDFPYWTDRNFPDRAQLIDALARQESVYAPATRYKYSNLGLALAGEVVAAVSGEAYPDYVRRHILEPLGMTSTAVRTEDIEPQALATGYEIRRRDGSQPRAAMTDSEALTPAANMSSNVIDLARFISLQFRDDEPGGGAVLQSSSLREMRRVHWLRADWSSGRGLGFGVWRQGDRTLVGHGGWVAGYRTQIAFDPAAKIGVIVLTNSDEEGPGAYVRQAFEMLAPAIESAAAADAEATRPLGLDRYVGTYHDLSGWLTDVLVLEGQLVMYGHDYPPTSDPKGEIVELTPEGEHTFRMTGENGNGELVVFEVEPDSSVARVKVGANYIFPEGCDGVDADLMCIRRTRN